MLFWRSQTLVRGGLLLYGISVAAIIVSFWGISSQMFSSPVVFVVVMAISTLIGLAPLALDRLLIGKVPAASMFWIYPASKAFLEFLSSVNGPFGVWGSQAGLMAAWYPFSQVVSLTGIWGLSFLSSLLASLLVYILENKLSLRRGLLVGLEYGALLLTVALFGVLRRESYQPHSQVKVAAVLANDSLKKEAVTKIYDEFLSSRQVWSKDSIQYFQESFARSNTDLLTQTSQAIAAGAKIIFWAEGNAVLLKDDEKKLIDTVSKLAAHHGVYIGIAAEVYHPLESKPVENKIILIQPDGGIAFEYLKYHPIGIEKELMRVGPGNIPTCETPYGRIGAVICFDTDFITYAREAGKLGVDLLFAPSNDWKEIANLRGKITLFRSLENGFTLVRPTSQGTTVMADATGRVLLANNYFENPQRVLIAEVPVGRMPAFYVEAGNWFALICGLGLLILLGRHLLVARRWPNSKWSVLAWLLLIGPMTGLSQTNQSDSSENNLPVDFEKGRSIFLPALSYAPETSLSGGISFIRFHKRTGVDRQSFTSGNFLYTLRHQFINEISTLHYWRQNKYMLSGSLRFNRFPEKFYGIGNDTHEESAEQITYEVIKSRIAVYRLLRPHLYLGPKLNYAQYFHLRSDNKLHSALDTIIGGGGSRNIGTGFSLVYDTRDNVVSSSSGWYVEFENNWYNRSIGSDHNYYSMDLDMRKFKTLKSGAILAIQAALSVKKGTVPFTQLSYLGGSNLMRGFYSGRYRDLDLAAAQAEYRRKLFGRWGFVLFAGAGKVSPSLRELPIHDWRKSAGFGFRRSIGRNSKVNLRIDVAFAQGNSNVYVGIGEAF